MAPIGFCLALATASAVPVFVPTEQLTLAWTHSIEKVRWEEDYAVRPATAQGEEPRLHAVTARVRGSAAGMEPPEGARLVDGWYVYTPAITQPPALRLTRSAFTADYELCVSGNCHPLSRWLPSDGDITLLTACRAPDGQHQQAPGGAAILDR